MEIEEKIRTEKEYDLKKKDALEAKNDNHKTETS